MAEKGENPAAEIQAHQQTWGGFKAMMFWGALGVFVIGFAVVLLIAQT
jgi:hypothetical protein